MIASLNGILMVRSPESIVIDVGGVGYKVGVTLNTFSQLPAQGEKVFLHIYTAVREDDISLFGFLDEMERSVFQKLIGITGIGPRLAMTILSGIVPKDLVDALHREDIVRLSAIPGIGKKTAERMIVDLKDKLQELLGKQVGSSPLPSRPSGLFEEAASALVNLGYHRSSAEKTLSSLTLHDGIALEAVIRQALRVLSEGGAKR